mmetsp:Transcript_33850/g.79121  ORF Transcript_33850/g.79121 Transcript_33850/m.79121 type:complete len:310 (+) Transcript_33850:108-1037(+)
MLSQRTAAAEVAAELDFIRTHDVTDVEKWYLIDAEWLKRWRCFAMRSGPSPGPITNLRLLDPALQFRAPKRGLEPVKHYRGVGEEVWQFFYSRYGGGPEISTPLLSIYESRLQIHNVSEGIESARQHQARMTERDSQARSRSNSRHGRRNSGSARERSVSRPQAFLAALRQRFQPQLRSQSSRPTCQDAAVCKPCEPLETHKEEAEVTQAERPQPRPCVICLDQTRNTRLLPCHHCILCIECANELFDAAPDGKPACPTCRAPVMRFEEAVFEQTFAPRKQQARPQPQVNRPQQQRRDQGRDSSRLLLR